MLYLISMLLLLTAAAIAGYFAYRIHIVGDARYRPSMWFAPRPEPRLGVSEQATIDGRRKLVLVRRDDVEHLLMIGGPVDIVVEENIRMREPVMAKAPAEPIPPVFSRQPRGFGQAVNE